MREIAFHSSKSYHCPSPDIQFYSITCNSVSYSSQWILGKTSKATSYMGCIGEYLQNFDRQTDRVILLALCNLKDTLAFDQ